MMQTGNHRYRSRRSSCFSPRKGFFMVQPHATSNLSAFIVVVILTFTLPSACVAMFQDGHEIAKKSKVDDSDKSTVNDSNKVDQKDKPGKVVGLKNACVHVLKLEKTLKLYREILGFELDKAVVLKGKGIEGMLVMELKANDFVIHLSLPAPGGAVGPIGNTNHNHFMLLVDDIVSICDRLKQEEYSLENDNYAKDKYTFFTGPNGEIIGLTEHR